MHQMWKTFRDSCSTRVFLQVDEKNALKHPKSWWLGVAPCSVVFSLIYLIDIREKWQILVKVIFDPSSCLENMNKHRETTLHIQIPYPGPKEHQNWAFGSNFTTSQVTMNAWNEVWKSIFWAFLSVETNWPIKIPYRGHKEYSLVLNRRRASCIWHNLDFARSSCIAIMFLSKKFGMSCISPWFSTFPAYFIAG